jgi:hypothetical protein
MQHISRCFQRQDNPFQICLRHVMRQLPGRKSAARMLLIRMLQIWRSVIRRRLGRLVVGWFPGIGAG